LTARAVGVIIRAIISKGGEMEEWKPRPIQGLKTACYGFTEFELDEETALKGWPVWVLESHCVPALTPLYLWMWVDGINHGWAYWNEKHSIPTCRGTQYRIWNGYFYIAGIEPEEEDIPKRAEKFRENMRPFLEDFWGMWQKEVAEWVQEMKPFMEFDLEGAPDFELRKCFDDYYLYLNRRHWYLHFRWMHAAYYIYLTFEDLLLELTGITTHDPLFTKLMGGFDNVTFVVSREQYRLADRARELGLGEIFTTIEDNEEVLRRLEQSEAGRKWLEEYHAFLKEHGWRCVRMMEFDTPSYIEQPSLAITDIRRAMIKGGVFTPDEDREQLVKERGEAEKEVLAKVPVEQGEWFEKLMRTAEQSGRWSEDHTYYFEMMHYATGRRIIKEIGKRFEREGVIDNWEDIFFLKPAEIDKAGLAMGRENLRPYVEARREEFERYDKMYEEGKIPPIIGTMEGVAKYAKMDDPVRVMMGEMLVRPELKADLYGMASAPGVVEGTARVCMSLEEAIETLQPGEILVAPITMAPWTPLFTIVSGVVTDAGASLSHPAIVSREFGIPAVTGTLEATRKIKTGDKIRVDGDMCCVYIQK
jgi:pyruvate,water dikinase